MDWSDATPYAPPPDGRSVDRFRKSLDWSTTDNPDAVPIVHPVIDQGSWYVHAVRSRSIHHAAIICSRTVWFLTLHTPILFHRPNSGACWAISATGTVEANAARHRAFEAYTDTEKRLTAKKLDSDEIRKAAIAAAREAELRAAIDLEPGHADARFHLGVLLSSQDDDAGAEAADSVLARIGVPVVDDAVLV